VLRCWSKFCIRGWWIDRWRKI